MSATQLRGKQLEDAIKDGILSLAKGKKEFKLNQTELAKVVNTSRATLNKYRDFIETVLSKIKASKRESNGSVAFQQMEMKVERLEKQKAALKKENDALRKNHLEIYGSLMLHSVKASKLIEPIIYDELNESGKCYACNQKITEEIKAKKSNVVNIKKKI